MNVRSFGRRRLIGATTLASTATAMFIAPAALLPGAEVSPMLVTVGVVGPFGIAALALTLMEQRIERDLRPAERPDSARPVEEARQTTIEAPEVRPAVPR